MLKLLAGSHDIFMELRGNLQEGETLPGYKVTRLEHALQAATRAYREGADTDWVVAAVLHDIGDGRGGIESALGLLAAHGARLTGVGIQDDILYGPRQVHLLVDAALAAGVRASYREIHSDKGHDAFLVEWDQMTAVIRELLDQG